MSFVGVLLMWSAMQHPEVTARAQQPTGYSHSWGASFGTVFNDEGRGIAVTNDGSVIWTGTTLDPASNPNNEEQVPMTFVVKYRRDHQPSDPPCWSIAFAVDDPMADSVVSRALALADPTVDLPTDGLAYVAGRFKGLVSFGVTNGPGSASYPASFVAKIKEVDGSCPGGAAQTAWVTAFTTEGTDPEHHRNSALAVAAGRAMRSCNQPSEDLSDAVFGTVAVGGFFNGTTTFNGPVGSNDDDAYIALLHGGTGAVTGLLVIGGPGNQRITALAIDDRTQDLFVAGWYDNTNTNFNPDPNTAPVYSSNYQNGRDMFVARIRLGSDRVPRLITLWTHGTPSAGPDYDDEAACIALGVNDDFDLSTLAFVGGWTTTPSGGRDLFAAAIHQSGSNIWVFNPTAAGDDRALAIAVDGLGRPVIAGHFGCPYTPNTACIPESVRINFNTTLLTPDRLDAFVARLHPLDGHAEWAYKIGGNFDESATAIAFDPASTDRFALTGWFGRPDAAPGQYTIDLDPGGNTTPATSAGFADAFIAQMRPVASESIGFQISLVLDTSCAMDLSDPPGFSPMMAMIRSEMSNPGAIPRPGGTRQAAVQVNAIFASSQVPTSPATLAARVVMPWTVIDDDTAGLFARRLAATSAPIPGPGPDHFSAALYLAHGRLPASGIGDEASRSILLMGNSIIWSDLRSAANAVVNEENGFDRVCALGVQWATREDLLLYAIAPMPTGATTADAIDRGSIGIAAEAAHFGLASSPFITLLQRLSWCPSDYTRDECTSRVSSPPNDLLAWFNAWSSSVDYADWNRDGTFNSIDTDKFAAGLPPSGFICHTCP